MKRPRALSESASRPSIRKSGFAEEEKQSLHEEEEEEEEEEEKEKAEKILRRRSESGVSFGRKAEGGNRISMQRISEVAENKLKKSQRRSFMGYILLFNYVIITLFSNFLMSHPSMILDSAEKNKT